MWPRAKKKKNLEEEEEEVEEEEQEAEEDEEELKRRRGRELEWGVGPSGVFSMSCRNFIWLDGRRVLEMGTLCCPRLRVGAGRVHFHLWLRE